MSVNMIVNANTAMTQAHMQGFCPNLVWLVWKLPAGGV